MSLEDRKLATTFLNTKDGHGFFSVVSILEKKKEKDLALELLVKGLASYPSYTAARVLLAERLLERSLIRPAWDKLEDDLQRIYQNTKGLNLAFQLALLLNKYDHWLDIEKKLRLEQRFTKENLNIITIYEQRGFQKARHVLNETLSKKGISYDLNQKELCVDEDHTSREKLSPLNQNIRGLKLQDRVKKNPRLTGFFACHTDHISLNQNLNPGQTVTSHMPTLNNMPTLNIPTEALAEIYESQGHYTKALEIYRDLLRQAPSNDRLRTRLVTLHHKKTTQDQKDYLHNPDLCEKMYQRHVLDQKTNLFYDLLSKLPQERSKI